MKFAPKQTSMLSQTERYRLQCLVTYLPNYASYVFPLFQKIVPFKLVFSRSDFKIILYNTEIKFGVESFFRCGRAASP